MRVAFLRGCGAWLQIALRCLGARCHDEHDPEPVHFHLPVIVCSADTRFLRWKR